jgi:hypothetical protein
MIECHQRHVSAAADTSVVDSSIGVPEPPERIAYAIDILPFGDVNPLYACMFQELNLEFADAPAQRRERIGKIVLTGQRPNHPFRHTHRISRKERLFMLPQRLTRLLKRRGQEPCGGMNYSLTPLLLITDCRLNPLPLGGM